MPSPIYCGLPETRKTRMKRCIEHVTARGHTTNPGAVCNAAIPKFSGTEPRRLKKGDPGYASARNRDGPRC